MDDLPNELLLCVFRYLHPFDVLFSFAGLNERFQRLTDPFVSVIDCTGNTLSYQHFLFFFQKLAPKLGDRVRSLTLNGEYQIRLVYPHLRHLRQLRSLTVKTDWYVDETERCVQRVLSTSTSLNDLSLSDWFGLRIVSVVSPNSVTSLKFTNLTYSYLPEVGDGRGMGPMPAITHLSISTRSMPALIKFCRLMPNVENLTVSILSPVDWNSFDFFIVPRKLRKLQLECGYDRGCRDEVTFDMLHKILHRFRRYVHSLTLIIFNAESALSDYDHFLRLTNSFEHLNQFEYHLCTEYRPDARFPRVRQTPFPYYSTYTRPRPCSAYFPSHQCTSSYAAHANFDGELTHRELFSCTTLRVCADARLPTPPPTFTLPDETYFVNLRRIELRQFNMRLPLFIHPLLGEIIARSPNFRTLTILSDFAEELVAALRPIRSFHRVKHLEFDVNWERGHYYPAFFRDLSDIFPNLNSLQYPCTREWMRQHTSNLSSAIDQLQQYFSRLTRLTLRVESERDRRGTFFAECKRDLLERQRKNLLYHKVKKTFGVSRGYAFEIWL